MKELKINYIDVIDLKSYENNPRKNSKAVQAVSESIKEFGFKNPIIIDKNNIIVAGHTRLKAAKKLGITKLPCVIIDDLTPEQIKAFRIADNSTAEIAEWDFLKLDEELANIDIDMSQFGLDIKTSEKIDIKEVELQPYEDVHYLISININNHDKIIKIIEELKKVEGVSIESTLN